MRSLKRLFVALACVVATSACAHLDPASRDALAADYLARCELMTGIERLACFDLFAPRAPGAQRGRG